MRLNKRSWIRRRIGMKIEILAADQLAAAAANGVYQGIIVTWVVAFSLRLFGRTNAATRHAVWFCTLLLVALLMIAHCWREYLAFALPAAKPALAPVPPLSTTLTKELKNGQNSISEFDIAPLDQETSAGQENALEEVARFDSSDFLSIETVMTESQIDAVLQPQLPEPTRLSDPGEKLQASSV